MEALARATAEIAGFAPSVGAGIRVEAFAFFGLLLDATRELRDPLGTKVGRLTDP